jgi:hypothetical protein
MISSDGLQFAWITLIIGVQGQMIGALRASFPSFCLSLPSRYSPVWPCVSRRHFFHSPFLFLNSFSSRWTATIVNLMVTTTIWAYYVLVVYISLGDDGHYIRINQSIIHGHLYLFLPLGMLDGDLSRGYHCIFHIVVSLDSFAPSVPTLNNLYIDCQLVTWCMRKPGVCDR